MISTKMFLGKLRHNMVIHNTLLRPTVQIFNPVSIRLFAPRGAPGHGFSAPTKPENESNDSE